MPVFHHPRRVQVDIGADPLVPALGVVALVVIAAALEAAASWASAVLGVLGAVPVPVAALVPGALGFAGTGYLLGRRRVVQLERRAARLPGGEPPAVIIAVPARAALSQGARRHDLGAGPETVLAGRRAQVRR